MPGHCEEITRKRKASRSGDRGFALAVVLMLISIVAVALSGAALTAGYGVLSASQTRRDLDFRMAATARASDVVPDVEGGSITPAAPVEGFSDFAAVDRETGAIRLYASSEAPTSGELVLRQWRVSALPSGGRLFEVSVVAVDSVTHAPLTGPQSARFVLTRVVE